MLLPFLTLVDLNSFRTNMRKPVDLSKIKKQSSDFVILIPIFNDIKYLTNINFLKRYGERVVLCTTNKESAGFKKELQKLSKAYGFRVTYSNIDQEIKNPWTLYNRTLIAHDAVLKENIKLIRAKYVIFIDGDTYIDGNPAVLAGAMEELKFDLASVRVLPGKRTNIIEHLQGVEYDIAMNARLIYPWLTSGAGMVAKRNAMIKIMKNHSLFFNGGDIEIGKLADMMGYKVGHLPMNFFTDIPSTFKAWVKQRGSWMCGAFRHSVINMHHNLRHPFHFIYFTFVMYFLMPAKIIDMSGHISILPIIIGLYILLTFIANWKLRSRWMLLFPFYALFQVIVLIWLGIFRYLITVYRTHNFGFMKATYKPAQTRSYKVRNIFSLARNALVALLITSGITLGISGTVQEAVFKTTYSPVELAGKAIRQTADAGSGLAAIINTLPRNLD